MASQTQIRLGYDNVEGAKIALFAGIDAGVFRGRGIDLAVERISPVKLGTPKLLSGEIDLLLGNSGPIVEAIARERKPLAVIASLGPASFAVFTRRTIGGAEELKGKTFGVSTPGASQDRIARRTLARLGLKPDEDVRIVYTGFNNSTDRLRALARGEVDGVIGGLENFPDFSELQRDEAAALKKLVDVEDVGIHISGSDIAATRGWIERRREDARNFVAALEESAALAGARADLVGRAFEKYLALETPAAVESKARGYYTLKIPARPLPDRLAIQNNLDEIEENSPGAALPSVADCVDESLFR